MQVESPTLYRKKVCVNSFVHDVWYCNYHFKNTVTTVRRTEEKGRYTKKGWGY